MYVTGCEMTKETCGLKKIIHSCGPSTCRRFMNHGGSYQIRPSPLHSQSYMNIINNALHTQAHYFKNIESYRDGIIVCIRSYKQHVLFFLSFMPCDVVHHACRPSTASGSDNHFSYRISLHVKLSSIISLGFPLPFFLSNFRLVMTNYVSPF